MYYSNVWNDTIRGRGIRNWLKTLVRKKIGYKEVFMINLKTSFCSRAIYEVKAILSLHTRPGQNFEIKWEPKVFFFGFFFGEKCKETKLSSWPWQS